MLLPAATVKVSVGPSATILDCPETAKVLNASVTVPPPPPIAPQAGVEPKYPSNSAVVVLYLNIPTAGEPGRWAVVPSGTCIQFPLDIDR